MRTAKGLLSEIFANAGHEQETFQRGLLGGPSRGIPELWPYNSCERGLLLKYLQNAAYESGTFQREASRETRGGFYLKANGHICHPLCLGKSMLAPEKLDFTILDKISQLRVAKRL